MKNYFEGKTILVTGGTGTIGLEIVKQLLNFNPHRIRIFSNDENGIYKTSEYFSGNTKLRYLMGDVRDFNRVLLACRKVDIIYHAAAMKHVPISEFNPFEAIKTNVDGTQNVIHAALENNVEKVIGISTDKAVNPINSMGATKLLSEKLLIDANFYRGDARTVFSVVRFGNVLGSRGSVIPKFITQIEKGGPVTVTDFNMSRYVMAISDAISLILKATRMAKGGEIFVLKSMRALNLKDLAEVCIQEFNKKYNLNESIQIVETGIRPGEKLYEKLLTEEEAKHTLQTNEMFIVTPQFPQMHFIEKSNDVQNTIKYDGLIEDNIKNYSSNELQLLSKKEIKEILYLHSLI
jgi:FlaA1/EpsC-like NDP-sugar epimerase